MKKLLFLSLMAATLLLRAQTTPDTASLLLSGPMVGYSEMREVLLWVQTNGPAVVQYEYTSGGDAPRFRTDAYQTTRENAYTAHVIANQVRPGMRYTYKLFINGKEVKRPYEMSFQTPPLWQWRSDPPAMKIALGSCNYINDEPFDRPGKPYGADYKIFTAIHAQKPDMMLWLGDNTYLREADWYSRTGIIHRYTHSRNVPEMQALLASSANYAIWDDHDYGPNDSDYTYRDKEDALEAFQLFWGNPSYGLPG
ncbi:MAG: alkaline phosphatase family protein, partial [Bacteroidetes bacterium]